MLDFIADRADLIIAGVQTALTLDMLPTIWTQFRARASTVPLTSSIPTAVGLAVLGLVFFATGLYIATATVLVGSVVWAIVAGQRMVYNRHDGSTARHLTQTPSFALTIVGYLALALHVVRLRRMDVIAPIKSMVYNITHEDLYRGGLRSARNSTRSLQQALPSLVPIRARKQKAVSGSKLRQIRAYPGMVWGTLFSMATKWRSKQDQIEAARTQDSLEQRICVHQNQRRNIQGRTSGCN
ncbi:hypothetical protein LCGC14_2962600, partial [marine sediment metagenome]